MNPDELDQAVLQTVEQAPPTSFPDLIDRLKQSGYSERDTRIAAWGLVERNRLQVTKDHKLVSVSAD